MTQYELVNKNLGDSVITTMYVHTESLLNDVFEITAMSIIEDENAYDNLYRKLMDNYENNLDTVKCCNSNQTTEQLNSFLTDDNISIDEALFCILGLNITAKPYDYSILNLNKHKNHSVIDSAIFKTSEYRKLIKAINVIEETGLVFTPTNDIYTIGFVAWALRKGFIKEIGNPIQSSKKNNKLDIHNARIKKIKDHNTGVLVKQYTLQIEKVTAHAFAMEDKYYNTYKDQLLPLLKTRKKPEALPERKVLYKYLRVALKLNK